MKATGTALVLALIVALPTLADGWRMSLTADETGRLASSVQYSDNGTHEAENTEQAWEWLVQSRTRARLREEVGVSTTPDGRPIGRNSTTERRSGDRFQLNGRRRWDWQDGRRMALAGALRRTDSVERERDAQSLILRNTDEIDSRGATLQSDWRSAAGQARRWTSSFMVSLDEEERRQRETNEAARFFDDAATRAVHEVDVTWFDEAQRRWRASLDVEYEARESLFTGEARSRVEIAEWRIEPGIGLRQAINEDVTAFARLDLEATQLLTSSLGTDTRRHSMDLKPTLTVQGNDWTLWMTRSVSQLDFVDFATNFDEFDEEIQTGNPDLRPQKSWELGAQRRLDWRGLSTRLRLEYRQIEDLLDFVAGPDDTTVRGNLGTGEVWRVGLEAEWAPQLGGRSLGELELSYQGQETRVFDPLLGAHRAFAETPDHVYALDYTYDLGALELGAALSGYSQSITVEQDRIDQERLSNPLMTLYGDWRRGPSQRWQLQMRNVLGVEDVRERIRFNGLPADNDVRRLEERRRREARTLTLTLRQSF